ncbi:MAG: S9 family peptidase [Vicinamibacteria bacterium]|nr:S9 family peptidase [Vicinamibacteria bacterium]
MLRRLALALLAAGLAAPTGLAADKKPLTADELWAVERVGAPQVSPDGTRVAFTVSRYDMGENRGDTDIHVVPLAGGTPKRLTTNKASDSSPAWSPDGTRIAFVSRREGDAAGQLYVIPTDGGEAERVTDLPLGVSGPRWLPDGKRIVVVSHVIAGHETPEATKKAKEAREKNKVSAKTSESRLYRFWDRWLTDEEYPRLFVVDVETKQATDLLPGSKRLFSFQTGAGSYDVSPDGRWIVFAANATEPPYLKVQSDLFLVATAGGEVKNLTAANPANDGDPVFSPDGRTIAFSMERKADDWPDYSRVALLDIATGKVTALTEAWDNSTGGYAFSADGKTIFFHSEVRARTGIYSVPVTGGTPREVVKGGVTSGVAVATGDALVFNHTTLAKPPELAVVNPDGSGWRDLTALNAERAASWDLGPSEEMVFAGAGGDEVQMFVAFPPGFDKSKKYPLLQVIHGGPVGTSADSFHFRWNAHAFAAPGYVVAMVNFHGSSSFGQKWVESILGAHPDKPFVDIMKATDFLIAKGYVDSARMAALGGSYGGFMVNWIAGHTDRFKALVSHAGVYSLLGQSASDATWGRHHSYGGYPFTNLANVEKWSPNRFAAGFKTPTLILHGERDYRVPVTQGLEFYGVLQAKGVPARLVYYPDENHWILKPQNSRHWYGEVHGWLARWLK